MVRGELNVKFQEVRATKYSYGEETVEEVIFISDTGNTLILSFADGSFEKIVEAIEKYDLWKGGN